jgi:iron-sulfur cluster assembly accessory protein
MEAPTAEIFTVTDPAARKVAQLATKEGRSEPVLRVRVVAGGCSGFSYKLAFDSAAEEDQIVEGPGAVRILIDPKSAPLLRGSTLDLDTNLIGGGLRVRNPQAVHECACGESFSV